tara:strand:+ start:761 stop:1189 length:429 start_codon:yes stop_codon:yes gene_type:complete
MAKAIRSSDGQSFTLSIAERQDFGNKATIDSLIALSNWAVNMRGEDVSTLIVIAKALAGRQKENAEYRAQNPPQPKTEEAKRTMIETQKTRLSEKGFTDAQITALENNGVLGTDEAYIAIGSIMRNDDKAEASRETLLAKAQ